MIFSINVLDIDQTVILRPATVNLTDQDAVHQFCRSPTLSLYHYTALTLHCSHIHISALPLYCKSSPHYQFNALPPNRCLTQLLSHFARLALTCSPTTIVLLSFSLTSPSLSCSPTQLLSSITADNDHDNRSCRSPACPDFGWHHLRLALPCSVCRELCSRSFRSTLRYAKLC